MRKRGILLVSIQVLLISIGGCLPSTAPLYLPPECDNDCTSQDTRLHCVMTNEIHRMVEQVSNQEGFRWNSDRPRGLLQHNILYEPDFIESEWVDCCLKGTNGSQAERGPVPLSTCKKRVTDYENELRKQTKVEGLDEALKEFTPEKRVAEIWARLHQPKFCLLWAAWGRPDECDAPVLVPHLRNALTAELSGTRATAALGLSHLEEAAADAIPDVRRALDDKNPAVRLYAAQALWRIQGWPDQGLPVLIEGLKDDRVADLAAMLLGEMSLDANSAVPALCELLHHKNEYVRAQAMFAIGRIGWAAAPAAPALCQALSRPENSATVYARRRIVHPDGTSEISQIERSVYSFAVCALGEIGPDADDALPTLQEFRQKTVWFSRDRVAVDAA